MADALVGATIKISLEKVVSLATDQIGMVSEFKEDLERLKKIVEMISAVLDDAEAKQAKHRAVDVWLKRLEALACRTDHVLDEVNYEILRRRVEDRNWLKGKVSFFPSHKTIVFRLRMARKLKDINNKFELINKDATALGLQSRLVAGVANTTVSPSKTGTSREKDSVVGQKVIGRENDASKIVHKLLSPSNELLTSIPIRGMGGLGKTTLAQLVYNDEKIVNHFGERIWVCVPEDCEPRSILRLILESLTKDNVESLKGRDTIVQKIKEKLKDKRYLLVLDDVWSENGESWDDFLGSLRGISTIPGNWIIVTTRKRQVASIFSAGTDFPLEKLSDEDCLDIVKEKALIHEDVIQYFEASRENIIKLCQGLPLVASVIGGLLRTNPTKNWHSLLHKEISKKTGDEYSHIMQILKLSFDHLPSASAKKCFTYCSLFEKDSSMEKKQLIELWMAEGFLQPKPGYDDMEIGNKYINSLLGSSLLQEVIDEKGECVCVRMHDLVHDLARSILKPTNDLKDVKDEDRYLVIDSFGEETKTFQKMRMLRTLFIGSGTPNGMLMMSFKHLHVLRLSYVGSHKLPSSIGKLIHLRYLDFSNSSIKDFPESISELYNLQTLRIEHCFHLGALPKGMTRMINLRHLHHDSFIKLPPKIGCLSSLQILEHFVISEENQIKELGFLKNLRGNLTIYNLERVRSKEEALQAGLNRKPMNRLSFIWSGEDEKDEEVLEGLQPHPHMQELEIVSFLGNQFPSWIMNMTVCKDQDPGLSQRLDRLVSLSIESCKRCKQLPALGQLPSLKYLKLRRLDDISSIEHSFYGTHDRSGSGNNIGSVQVRRKIFPALRHLLVEWMENLKEWMEYQTTNSEVVEMFPNLEALEIDGCPRLSHAPIHYFQSLKHLKISRTNLDHVFPTVGKDQICSRSPNSAHVQQGISTSLESLKIYSCDNLCELPEYLYEFQFLRIWDIKFCSNLKSLPIPMGQQRITSLQKLAIGNCHGLTSLPQELLNSCASLTHLDITSCNGLSSLPADLLKSCVSLHSLRIWDCNGLSCLPTDFLKSCVSLQSLEIYACNGLSSLPTDFLKSCVSLHSLEIYACNGLSRLPADLLRSCVSLHSLTIRNCNRLFCLPPDFLKSCVSLHSLTIWNCNGLSSLPTDLLRSCVSLQHLYINELRNLESFPFDLQQMPSLSSLYLYRLPKLMTAPKSETGSYSSRLSELYIGGFSDSGEAYWSLLSWLSLSLRILGLATWPNLVSLPEHLRHLTVLRRLFITDLGQIEALPDWFANLVSLEVLYLSHCEKLCYLPSVAAMRSLTKLSTLFIFQCPLLKERCIQRSGPNSEWAKISHIPTVYIDNQLIESDAGTKCFGLQMACL